MSRIIITFCVVPLIQGLLDPFIHSKIGKEEYIDIKETGLSYNGRRTRSTELLYPSLLNFNLTFENGETTNLHLRKTTMIDHKVQDVPVYVLKNDEIVRQIIKTNKEEMVHFYQDVERMAAIGIQTVNTDAGPVYAMAGTIQLRDAHHMIRPRSVDGKIKHTTTKTDDGFTFGTDFVIDEFRNPIFHEPRKGTKTSSTTVYNVELLAITDYAIYNFWDSNSLLQDKAQRDEEVKTNILEYYSYITNTMDVVYGSITGTDWEINIVFAGIVIIDSINSFNVTEDIKLNGTSEFSHFVHGVTTLEQFGLWLEEYDTDLPNYDHAMLFTGYDMYSDDTSNAGLLGIAWVERICSRRLYNTYLENSVVEDIFGGQMALVAAHELGHNLGAWHDGSQGNLCSSTDRYNMAPFIGAVLGDIGKNVYTFSNCSIDYFNNFINELNENNANCMATLGPEYDSNWFDDYKETLYGQVYSAEEQCQKLSPLGNETYACKSSYQDNLPGLCTLLFCYIGDNLCQGYFPLEGTQCGLGKLCTGGYCVDDSRAANVSESCVFGDDPSFTLDGKRCDVLLSTSSVLCYDENVLAGCCWSCAEANTGRSGCEYGDRVAGCSIANCATNSNNDCCQTCNNDTITTEVTTLKETTSSEGTNTMQETTVNGQLTSQELLGLESTTTKKTSTTDSKTSGSIPVTVIAIIGIAAIAVSMVICVFVVKMCKKHFSDKVFPGAA